MTATAKTDGRKPFRVLLADDHAPTRQEMVTLIGREDDLLVVADVATGEEAVTTAQTVCPDFIVLDILLPRMNGIEVCRVITDKLPGVRVVALSNHSGQRLVKAFFAAGGMGYVRKDHAVEELVPAIRSILAGRQYLGHDVMESA